MEDVINSAADSGDVVNQINKPVINVIDVVILVSLLGLGAYWLFIRKKKSDFDASSIKTFAIE